MAVETGLGWNLDAAADLLESLGRRHGPLSASASSMAHWACGTWGGKKDTGTQEAGVPEPALPLASCATLGKSLSP